MRGSLALCASTKAWILTSLIATQSRHYFKLGHWRIKAGFFDVEKPIGCLLQRLSDVLGTHSFDVVFVGSRLWLRTLQFERHVREL